MLTLSSTGDQSHRLAAGEESGQRAYFYRVAALPGPDGGDVAVCAVRRHGVGFGLLLPESDHHTDATHTFATGAFPGIDVVDVCPLAPGSLAVAAVGQDGTLILFRNVLTDRNPVAGKFAGIRGKAYRLLSAAGHLLLLTGEELYLTGLAARFAAPGSSDDLTTQILATPIEAVDINLAGHRTLLVVMPDSHVRIIDIADLAKGAPPRAVTPTQGSVPSVWRERPAARVAQEFALA